MTSNTDFIAAAILVLVPVSLLFHWFVRSFILATVLNVIVVIGAVIFGLRHLQSNYPIVYSYVLPYIHYKMIALWAALESVVLGVAVYIFKKRFQTTWYFYIAGLVILLGISALCLYFAKKEATQGFNHTELGRIWQESQLAQQTLTRTVRAALTLF